MTQRAPIVDERIHSEMVSLVGKGRIDHYLGILSERLEGISGIDREPVDAHRLAEVHRVVSEAGCLGFARLSTDCRALEHAVKLGDPHEAAKVAGLAAESVRATLAEIEQRRAA